MSAASAQPTPANDSVKPVDPTSLNENGRKERRDSAKNSQSDGGAAQRRRSLKAQGNGSTEDRKDGEPKRSADSNRRRSSTKAADAKNAGSKPTRQISERNENKRGFGGGRPQNKPFTRTDSNVSEKRRVNSTASSGPDRRPSTNRRSGDDPRRSSAATGDGDSDAFYDDDQLEEPFSDSEEDEITKRVRASRKMLLPLPRGRIRTLSGTVPPVGYSPRWGGPTMCLQCLQFFDLPDQIETFGEHLLQQHHIIIVEIDLIVDQKRYVEHWRQRFARQPVDDIFPRIEPKEGHPLHGVIDFYYEMAPQLAEDMQLRQRLALRRLEEVLACQHRERTDASFSVQCIFCRYTARGSRSKIIHHLYMLHNLNLGSPENLIFVAEYIEHLREKINRNECLYCERIFLDRPTLMDHMRKRNHREVNPKNHYYDRFYAVNYLQLGKRWLDVLEEDIEDNTHAFVDSDEEEGVEDGRDGWCEWHEDNCGEEEIRAMCLVCDESEEKVDALLEHMKSTHTFDLLQWLEKHGASDTYGRARFINFVRKQTYRSTCWVCGRTELGNALSVRAHVATHEPLDETKLDEAVLQDADNLRPIYDNDHLLWMLESYIEQLAEAAETPLADRIVGLTMNPVASKIHDSKENTVEGVLAEDLPPLVDLREALSLLNHDDSNLLDETLNVSDDEENALDATIKVDGAAAATR